MRENADQKISEYDHFLHSVYGLEMPYLALISIFCTHKINHNYRKIEQPYPSGVFKMSQSR